MAVTFVPVCFCEGAKSEKTIIEPSVHETQCRYMMRIKPRLADFSQRASIKKDENRGEIGLLIPLYADLGMN